MMKYTVDSLTVDLKNTLRDQFLKNLWLREYIINFKHYSDLQRIKGSKRNKKALVIGNGPSLDLIPIDEIIKFQKNGGEIFLMNHFNLRKELLQIQPDYYFSADPNTIKEENFSQVCEHIKNSETCEVYVPMQMIKDYEKIFTNNSVGGFCGIEIRRGLFSQNISIKPNRPHSFSSMTAYHALSMAIWLNYSKIFIIGLDNTYLSNAICDSQNRIFEVLKHASTDDVKIFRGDEYETIFDYFYENSRLFNDLNKFRGHNITNLNPDSLIDAFEKCSSIQESITLLTKASSIS